MTPNEQQQIMTIIENITAQSGQIPFLKNLLDHPVFGTSIAALGKSQHKEIQELINTYLIQWLERKKTKGAAFFKRFMTASPEIFWDFRAANDPQSKVSEKKFQSLGKQVEQELFIYEGKLTENMFKQEKGLDKVIDSFYTLVYCVFPRYNDID